MKKFFQDTGILTIPKSAFSLGDLKSRLAGALALYAVAVTELEENELSLKAKGFTVPSERNPFGAISQGKLMLSSNDEVYKIAYTLELGGLRNLVYMVASGGGLVGFSSQASIALSVVVGLGGGLITGLLFYIVYLAVHTATFTKTINKVVAGGLTGLQDN